MGQAQSGPQGPQGLQGPRGDTGLIGPPGKDATVDLKQVTDSIIINKTFQNQLVPLISKDNTLTAGVSKEVANDTTFSNTIINSMAADARFKGPPGKDSDPDKVATLLAADDKFSSKLAPFVAKDSELINTVGQQLLQNTTFSNTLLGTMATDSRFKGPKGTDSTPQDVANALSKDTVFTNSLSQKVASDTTFSNTLINSIATDSRFKGPKGKDADININTNNLPLLTQNLVSSNTFLANLAPYIANNNQLGQNIATNLTSNVVPRTLITNSLTQDENYRKTLVEAMAADTRFRGPQGTPGSALDANSLRLAVEPRSLWCADGQMCKTPTNSPGTIINGSLNIGNWTISENANGNLQFSKKGFANGNVIFDTTFQPTIGMTISSGNLLAKNDLKTGYAYINNNIEAGGAIQSLGGEFIMGKPGNNSNPDGLWSIKRNGNQLEIQRNDGPTWNTKARIYQHGDIEAIGHLNSNAGEVGFGSYGGNNDGVFKIKREPNNSSGELQVQRADGANNWNKKGRLNT